MYFLRSSFASIATGKERTWSELGTNLVRRRYGAIPNLLCKKLMLSEL